jgi:hypothetical protein
MGTNPQTFFLFAAEHAQLIEDLYRTREGVAEPDLRRLISRHEGEQSPGTGYMVKRLLELRILEPCPGHDARYEMTRACSTLMEFLLSEYRLTDVAVIQAYLTAMDSLASEFSQAVGTSDGALLARSIIEMEEHVERMRQDSANNRAAVIAQVMRVKSNPDGLPVQERYRMINRLWSRYIAPLQEMVDTNKAMEETLDRVETCAAEAETAFELDGALQPRLASVRARIGRMRRELINDFSESIREVYPLYNDLRHENNLARGAAYGLELLSKRKLSHAALSRRLPLCSWRPREHIDDDALRAYLAGLKEYRTRAPHLPNSAAELPPEHIQLPAFDDAVTAALPIDDALAWLLNTYPGLPLSVLLRLYGRMRSGHFGDVSFAAELVTLLCHETQLESLPVRISPRSEAA